MKIHYTIARGYASDIAGYSSVGDWVTAKWVPWITNNITDDFTIGDISEREFVIEFDSPEHAEQFKRIMGGRIDS